MDNGVGTDWGTEGWVECRRAKVQKNWDNYNRIREKKGKTLKKVTRLLHFMLYIHTKFHMDCRSKYDR